MLCDVSRLFAESGQTCSTCSGEQDGLKCLCGWVPN